MAINTSGQIYSGGADWLNQRRAGSLNEQRDIYNTWVQAYGRPPSQAEFDTFRQSAMNPETGRLNDNWQWALQNEAATRPMWGRVDPDPSQYMAAPTDRYANNAATTNFADYTQPLGRDVLDAIMNQGYNTFNQPGVDVSGSNVPWQYRYTDETTGWRNPAITFAGPGSGIPEGWQADYDPMTGEFRGLADVRPQMSDTIAAIAASLFAGGLAAGAAGGAGTAGSVGGGGAGGAGAGGAGISGFGDAGLMYAGADAGAAGSLGGGASIGGGSALGAGGAGISGFGDAGTMYAGADASSAGTLGGGSSIGGGAPLGAGPFGGGGSTGGGISPNDLASPGTSSPGGSSMPFDLGNPKTWLGLGSTVLGALGGAQGQDASTTTTQSLPSYLQGPVTQDLLPRVQDTLASQQGDLGWAGRQVMGRGLDIMGRPIAENGFGRVQLERPDTPSNPYLSARADDIQRRTQEMLGQNNLDIQGRSVGTGGLGGSRQGVYQGEAAGRAADFLSGNLAGMYGQAYDADMNRALSKYGTDVNFYGQQRAQDLGQITVGSGLLSQGAQLPWTGLLNASSVYSPYSGMGTTTTGGQQGGGAMGAIGGALGAAQWANNMGLFGSRSNPSGGSTSGWW